MLEMKKLTKPKMCQPRKMAFSTAICVQGGKTHKSRRESPGNIMINKFGERRLQRFCEVNTEWELLK